MTSEIPDLDARGLRKFGLGTGAALAVVFGIALPWLLAVPRPWWPWIAGGALALWALVAPGTMKGFHRAWMGMALRIGRVSTLVLMSLIFFLVITPTALIMRIAGRDAMARRPDPRRQSYRIAARTPPKDHMERPF